MPKWIHDRAKHILAKNPDMPESMAWGIATNQSKDKEPGKVKKPRPGQVKQAFMEVLPSLGGLATGYTPGRSVAGETAASLAPKGRVQRSENFARNAAVVGVPLGGLAGMAIAKRYNLAPKLTKVLSNVFPSGLIAEPDVEAEIIRHGIPGAAAIVGSLGGGALTGGLVGGVQRLRGPTHREKTSAAVGPSPMWSTIGGAYKKPAWRAQSGITPPGMQTSAQRLQKSMSMGAFNRDKGLKPLEIKMGQVLLGITKKSFAVSQYSGDMNPPAMVYNSSIPAWNEPPVKTGGPPSERKGKDVEDEEKTAETIDHRQVPIEAVSFSPREHQERRRVEKARALGLLGGGAAGYMLGAHSPDFPMGRLGTSLAGGGVGATLAGLGALGVNKLTRTPEHEKEMADRRALRAEWEGKEITAAAVTPMGRLSAAKAVGAPRMSTPGPSIAQIAKPKGYGQPIAGAIKP